MRYLLDHLASATTVSKKLGHSKQFNSCWESFGCVKFFKGFFLHFSSCYALGVSMSEAAIPADSTCIDLVVEFESILALTALKAFTFSKLSCSSTKGYINCKQRILTKSLVATRCQICSRQSTSFVISYFLCFTLGLRTIGYRNATKNHNRHLIVRKLSPGL